MKRHLVLLLPALLPWCILPAIQAAEVTWNNPAGGNWSNPANWETGSVPAEGDDVFITVSGNYTVTLDVDATVASITLGGELGLQTLTNANRGLTLTDSSLVLSNATLGLGGGTLTAQGPIAIAGTFEWTGGSLLGSGSTVVAEGGTLRISGSGSKTWREHTIDNAGRVVWEGTGNLNSGQGGGLENRPAGLVEIEGDAVWAFNQGGAAQQIQNHGTLRKSGGMGETRIQARIDNDGLIDVHTGTLRLSGPTFASPVESILAGSGTLHISDTTVTAEATVNPGNPLGVLTVIGDLPASIDSVLNIELGGTNTGIEFDQLIVIGTASLRGTLNVAVVNDFQPMAGDVFEIVRFASSTGTFDRLAGLSLGSELYLEPTFSTTNVVLTVIDGRPRPVFGHGSTLPDGSAHFRISNVAGMSFIVEATPNLELPDWQPVLTNMNSGALFEFIDQDAENFDRRFFRAILLPPEN